MVPTWSTNEIWAFQVARNRSDLLDPIWAWLLTPDEPFPDPIPQLDALWHEPRPKCVEAYRLRLQGLLRKLQRALRDFKQKRNERLVKLMRRRMSQKAARAHLSEHPPPSADLPRWRRLERRAYTNLLSSLCAPTSSCLQLGEIISKALQSRSRDVLDFAASISGHAKTAGLPDSWVAAMNSLRYSSLRATSERMFAINLEQLWHAIEAFDNQIEDYLDDLRNGPVQQGSNPGPPTQTPVQPSFSLYENRLIHNGVAIDQKLTPQELRFLDLLIKANGKVVTKEKFRDSDIMHVSQIKCRMLRKLGLEVLRTRIRAASGGYLLSES